MRKNNLAWVKKKRKFLSAVRESEILIRRHVLWCLIWVCPFHIDPISRTLDFKSGILDRLQATDKHHKRELGNTVAQWHIGRVLHVDMGSKGS